MSCSGLTVAVLTPHAAAGLEAELPTMTSGRPAALVAPIRPRGFCLRYGFTDTGRVMRGENVLALSPAARG